MITAKAGRVSLVSSRDEIRFEIIQALTRTARDAVQQIKLELPRRFTLRRNWAIKGIRFDAATKAYPVARVYSLDPYMAKQEEGETYSPRGRHVAIPGPGVRTQKNAIIPSQLFPQKLKGRKDIFRGTVKGIGMGLFRRQGKGFKILYLLRERKQTMPTWEFRETVSETVKKRFDDNFK